jgi:hypothetical protein
MKRNYKAKEIVDILGIPFDVEYVEKIKDIEDGLLSGESDGSRHKISISKSENQTEDHIESTILHEIIHSILYISGQNATLANMAIEEGIVLALENGLHKLYKRR